MLPQPNQWKRRHTTNMRRSINKVVGVTLFFGCVTLSSIGDDVLSIQKQIVQTMIGQLASDNSKDRLKAKSVLSAPQYWRLLKDSAPEIVKALKEDLQSENTLEILGLLPLPADLQKQILELPQTPDKVRARLGDKIAEIRIIDAYAASEHPNVRQDKGLDLLYVGSAVTMKVVFEGLESRATYSVGGFSPCDTSLAGLLIYQFTKTNPDVPVFQIREFDKHMYVTEERFRDQEHQDYLRRVERYFKDTYDVNLKIDPPFFYVSVHIE